MLYKLLLFLCAIFTCKGLNSPFSDIRSFGKNLKVNNTEDELIVSHDSRTIIVSSERVSLPRGAALFIYNHKNMFKLGAFKSSNLEEDALNLNDIVLIAFGSKLTIADAHKVHSCYIDSECKELSWPVVGSRYNSIGR